MVSLFSGGAAQTLQKMARKHNNRKRPNKAAAGAESNKDSPPPSTLRMTPSPVGNIGGPVRTPSPLTRGGPSPNYHPNQHQYGTVQGMSLSAFTDRF